MRPRIWSDWLADCEALDDTPVAAAVERALNEPTGIDCFDAWKVELVETGYLHNHARMWFASVWTFTLGLPWQLGARFFLRHLLDGDAASNTLSWRWVAGIQTRGKHYLATAENLARFTEGRFSGGGHLIEDAAAVDDDREYPAEALALPSEKLPLRARVGVLLHGEDCSFEIALSPQIQPVALAAGWPDGFCQIGGRAPTVTTFRKDALIDATERAGLRWNLPSTDLLAGSWADAVNEWATRNRLDLIVTPYLSVGPWRDFLRPTLVKVDCPVHEVLRDWDRSLWPHAERGFFPFRKKLRALPIVRQHADRADQAGEFART